MVPTEDKIDWALKHLRNHLSGGPSGIMSVNTKRWMAEARKKKREEAVAEQKPSAEGTTEVLGGTGVRG